MISTDEQVHYEELYRGLIEQMELMHKQNLHNIKVGFRSILIVPTIFLLLLFFTKSSKTVFLILWIVSMFIIAVYLVIVEYSDYKLQAKINAATDNEGVQATSMIQENIESNRSALHELLMREERKFPFKFGFEQAAGDLDAAEYDTGDSPVEELSEDDISFSYDADSFDSGGLSADDYDTLPCDYADDESVIQAEEDEDYDQPSDDTAPEPVIQISDIDDDMDSIATLLDDSDDEPAAEPAAQPPVKECPSLTDGQAADDAGGESDDAYSLSDSNLTVDDILSEYHSSDDMDYDLPEDPGENSDDFEETRL